MPNLQLSDQHDISEQMVGIVTDRAINKLDHIVYKVLNPNIECEICHNTWDIFSPCALCNATRAFPSYRT